MPKGLDAGILAPLVVQHDGRYMPLDTLARDVVSHVTSTDIVPGDRAALALLSWTCDAAACEDERLIPVTNRKLREAIGLPIEQDVFSYRQLANHPHFRSLIEEALNLPAGQRADPLQSKVLKIREKMATLEGILQGQAIRLVPNPDDPQEQWQNVAELARADDTHLQPARLAWMAIMAAVRADDGPAFTDAADQLTAELQKLPAAYRPTPARIAKELRYNTLQAYRKAWIALTLATLLAALALVFRRHWLDRVAAGFTLAGFAVFTYGLSLRWAIAGRIPASNMFESLLFLSWGAAAFAFVSFFIFRHRSVPLTAAAIGALSLCLADCLPIDSFIRPVAPVLLDTFWMSVHVPIIMISYAVLAIAVTLAHVQVAACAVLKADKPLLATLDLLLHRYILVGSFLLFIGIATGSMWAASSWGRYWGWDPKEVWSLVALLGYMAILHIRLHRGRPRTWMLVLALALSGFVFVVVAVNLGALTAAKVFTLIGAAAAGVYFALARSRFATAAKSIIAFWLIIMTYVGVNYVLGTGLHSYGFGAGAVAGRMCVIGTIDLVVLVGFGAVYYLRQRVSQGGAVPGLEASARVS